MSDRRAWWRPRRAASSHWQERHEDDRLSALLDDELVEDDALQVVRHLAYCRRCERELEQVRVVRAAVRALPALVPPPGLYDEVMARAGSTGAHRGPPRLARRLAAAGVAAVGLFGAVAFVAGDDSGGTVVPPVETFVVDHVARFGGGPVITPIDLGP